MPDSTGEATTARGCALTRRRARQAEILAAAARVFAAVGYHSAQVARVAREAGVADGTIYIYFHSKEELLLELFRQALGRFLVDLDTALGAVADPRQKLLALVRHHLTFLGSELQVAVVTQVELRHSDPDLRRAIGQLVRPYFQRIEGLLEDGRARGVFDPDLDVPVARRLVFGALDEQVTAWVRSGGRFALADLTPAVGRLLLRAVAADAAGPLDGDGQ